MRHRIHLSRRERVPQRIETRDLTPGISGVLHCIEVLDAATGLVVKRYPGKKNLILDSGLDQFDTQRIAATFAFANYGSGTTPTEWAGAGTASQSGTTVTLSGADTNMAIGRLIRWGSGETTRITAGSGTSWTAQKSQTVASGSYTIYGVNQTGLVSFIRSTSTYSPPGSSNQGEITAITSGGQTIGYTNRRTYTFGATSGSENVNEVAFSRTSNANYLSRIVLPSTVSLVAGQQLRLVYDVTWVFGPRPSGTTDITITGWGTFTSCPHYMSRLNRSYVTSTGGLAVDVSAHSEPSEAMQRIVLSSSSALPSDGSYIGSKLDFGKDSTRVKSINSNGEYQLTCTATFGTAEGNFTNIRAIGYGSYDQPVYSILLPSNQTKLDTHNLTITGTVTWDRRW